LTSSASPEDLEETAGLEKQTARLRGQDKRRKENKLAEEERKEKKTAAKRQQVSRSEETVITKTESAQTSEKFFEKKNAEAAKEAKRSEQKRLANERDDAKRLVEEKQLKFEHKLTEQKSEETDITPDEEALTAELNKMLTDLSKNNPGKIAAHGKITAQKVHNILSKDNRNRFLWGLLQGAKLTKGNGIENLELCTDDLAKKINTEFKDADTKMKLLKYFCGSHRRRLPVMERLLQEIKDSSKF